MTDFIAIKTHTDDDKNDKHYKVRDNPGKMTEYFWESGVHGPVSAIDSIANFYIMGTTDVSTTMSFDLDIISDVDNYIADHRVDPSIQFCFAYTTTVRKGQGAAIVRRMRVANFKLELSDVVEGITSSLDTEALAVVSDYEKNSVRMIMPFLDRSKLTSNVCRINSTSFQ